MTTRRRILSAGPAGVLRAGSTTPSVTVVVDDFEDGDVSDWVNDTGPAMGAQNTDSYQGSWRGNSPSDNGTNSRNHKTIPAGTVQPTYVSSAVRASSGASGATNTRVFAGWLSGATPVFYAPALDLRDSNVWAIGDGVVNTGVSASDDTWYFCELDDIDWQAEAVGEVRINGSITNTNVSFLNSASGVDRVEAFGASNGTQNHNVDFYRYKV